MKARSNLFLNKLLLSAYNFSLFSEGVILPIYAIFVQTIGGDLLDAGLAIGLFLVAEGIFTIIIHRSRRDYAQRLKMMKLGWFIWLVGIVFYLFISNRLTLFLAQIMLALGNAIADPLYDEEYSNTTQKKIAERQWGNFEGSKSIIDGISAIIGGIIASLFGFKMLIFLMVFSGTISFILILFYSHMTKRSC